MTFLPSEVCPLSRWNVVLPSCAFTWATRHRLTTILDRFAAALQGIDPTESEADSEESA